MKKTVTNADVSYANSLKYKIKILFESLSSRGLVSTLKKIYQRVYYRLKGVDFSTQNIYDLTLVGEYKEHGTALVSTSRDFLNDLLFDLEQIVGKKIDKELFLDYGSGKGGAIIHARYSGFRESIGIEFAKELHLIACRNIERLNLKNTTSYLQDATEYLPPYNVSLIYLFNPFDEIVMDKVAKNIASLRGKYKNEVYIVYGNPSSKILRDYFKLIGKREYKSGARVEYFIV